jgi:hypothetical protein
VSHLFSSVFFVADAFGFAAALGLAAVFFAAGFGLSCVAVSLAERFLAPIDSTWILVSLLRWPVCRR